MKKKVITICSSAIFYKDVVNIADQLKKLGFHVKIPKTASRMKRNNDFDVSHYKVWFKDKTLYHKKKRLMNAHIKKVVESDAVLFVNHEKKGIKGYIGGNGLIEMFVAHKNRKPIYVLNRVDQNHMLIEEVETFSPIYLNGDITKISIK